MRGGGNERKRGKKNTTTATQRKKDTTPNGLCCFMVKCSFLGSDVKKFRYIFTREYFNLCNCKVVVKYECVKLNVVLCVFYNCDGDDCFL